MAMYDETSAGAVLYRLNENFQKEYLILNYNYGHWDFPKGNIESGETEIETIKREILEETGIKDIQIKQGFREHVSYKYRKKSKLINKSVIYYLAETKSKQVTLSFEHNDYAWLDYAKSNTKLSFANSKKVLKNANEYRLDHDNQIN